MTGPLLADIVMAAMAVEFVLLVVAGREPASALVALLPGVLLALALRAALVGADWVWVALPLSLSLPMHLADLGARDWLRRARRPTSTAIEEWRGS